MADELDIPLSFEALLDGSAEGAHADEAARCAQRLATATKVRAPAHNCHFLSAAARSPPRIRKHQAPAPPVLCPSPTHG